MSNFCLKLAKPSPIFISNIKKLFSLIFFCFLYFIKKDSSVTTEPFAPLCFRIFLKVSYSLRDSLNKWLLRDRHCSRPRGTLGHKTDKIICSHEAMFQYQRLRSNKIKAWRMLNSDELLRRKLKQRRAIGSVGGCWNFRQNDRKSCRDLSKDVEELRERLIGYLGSKVWKTGNNI